MHAAASNEARGEEGNGRHTPAGHPREALSQLPGLLAEIKEYAAYYLSAKFDGLKVTGRNLGIYAALGIVGFVAFSAMITTAVVLLLVGLSAALGHLFSKLINPAWAWLGPLLVGLLLLGGIGLGAFLALKKLMGKFRQATVQKYEQRQNWQRGQFGRNVAQQAASHGH